MATCFGPQGGPPSAYQTNVIQHKTRLTIFTNSSIVVTLSLV